MDTIIFIDFNDLDSATTEDLQAALAELRDDSDFEAEEMAAWITDELWSRGEQDF